MQRLFIVQLVSVQFGVRLAAIFAVLLVPALTLSQPDASTQPDPSTQPAVSAQPTVAAQPAVAAKRQASRLEGSVRLGMEYDNNPLRLQSDDPRLQSDDPDLDFLHDQPDMLARYFATIDSSHRVGAAGQASLRVRHGGKFYQHTAEADALLTQALISYRYRVAERVSVLFNADVKDRTERLSRLDYNRGGIRLGVGWSPDFWSPGAWRLSAGAGWRYFAYKPVATLGSQGPQFDGSLRRYFGDTVAGEVSYSLALRDFDSADTGGGTQTRTDTFHTARAGFVYRSDFFIDVMYVLSLNRSTLDAQDLTRHGLELTLTAPLFEEFYGSSKLQLQRTQIDDQSRPDALFFVDEENRNVAVLSLARPIGESWEVEGRWSMYLEEFEDDGPSGGQVALNYSRQTFLLAVGWGFE
jgi:hypothetical protein